jgi:anti-anti-sigma factor
MSASFDDPAFCDPFDDVTFVHDSLPTADVLRVCGELDFGNSAKFAAALERAARLEYPLAVDLTKCRYMDASVISVLVRARTTLSSRLSIVADPNGIPKRLLSITNVDAALHVTPSIVDALAPRSTTKFF